MSQQNFTVLFQEARRQPAWVQPGATQMSDTPIQFGKFIVIGNIVRYMDHPESDRAVEFSCKDDDAAVDLAWTLARKVDSVGVVTP